MSNIVWPKKPLSSLTSKIGDGIHGTPVYVETGGFPFVNGNNLKQGAIVIAEDTKRVDQEEFEKYFIKFDENTLFMSINGTLGSLAKYNGEQIILGKSAAYIKCKGINIDYLYYYLQLKKVQNQMWNIATGSTIKNLSLASIRGLEVPVPSGNTQTKIAQVLSVIDTKIELNNRINAELEAMAKTLYNYWFVQFDFPFDFAQGKPDANGKPYKTSGGKMVYDPILKREIPEGWGWKTIDKLVDVRDGTHDSPKPSPRGQYLITSKHLKESGIDFSDAYLISEEDFEAVNKRSKVDEGDFLLSMIGTIGLSQWVMKIETPFAIKNIGLFKTSQSPEWADYIFSSVTSDFGKFYLKQNQSTGTSQSYVTLGTLRSIPIVVPSNDVFQSFNEKVRPLHRAIYGNICENQKLTQLRDWLLPMLMNGQVTVKQ